MKLYKLPEHVLKQDTTPRQYDTLQILEIVMRQRGSKPFIVQHVMPNLLLNQRLNCYTIECKLKLQSYSFIIRWLSLYRYQVKDL